MLKNKRFSCNDSLNYFNKKFTKELVCIIDNKNNFIKVTKEKKILDWEKFIYNKLKEFKKNFVPDTIFNDKDCIYKLHNLVSLRCFITNNKNHFSFIINEIFSYTYSFYYSYSFVHGNLHIDNIFIDPLTFFKKPCFFFIDLSNSYIINCRHSMPEYKRSSFLFEYDLKTYDSNFIYWDIFTLFLSLKTFINSSKFTKNSDKYINILYNSTHMFVKKELLDKMIDTYVDEENIELLYNYIEN